MISESIADDCKEIIKKLLFDAEHFFDGYKHLIKNMLLECIISAYKAGARWVVLCDTNGGTLPQ